MRKKVDLQGKLLVTKIKIDNTIYVLCNVYAPTREHKSDQNNFINIVKYTLAPYVNENIFLENLLFSYLYLTVQSHSSHALVNLSKYLISV